MLPVRNGGQQRALQWQKALGMYARVTCVTSRASEGYQQGNVKVLPMLKAGIVRYFDFWGLRQLRPLAMEADIIAVDQPFWGFLAVILAKTAGKPLVVHAHNVEFQRFKSLGKFWWKALIFYEKWVLEQASLVIFISEPDRAFAVQAFRLQQTRTWVFPYTMEPQRHMASKKELRKALHSKLGIPEQSPMVVFFGDFGYAPNAEALRVLAVEIAPRLQVLAPNAFIVVFGKGVSATFSAKYLAPVRNLTYIGFVEDIGEMVAAADAMVNPVLTGGGVKTKVLESLAMGIPVVSTDTGALGVEKALCGELLHLFRDGDWETCTQLLVMAFQTKGVLPEAFRQYYDPDVATNQLWESAISPLLQKKHPTTI
jgi:glycosyltransferase involved in cell wall biosynthesis